GALAYAPRGACLAVRSLTAASRRRTGAPQGEVRTHGGRTFASRWRQYRRTGRIMERRTVFFVSDQTGVTAETMGHSLLTQFDGQAFRQVTLPFISTVEKAEEAVRRIDATAAAEGVRPVIFSTLVQEDMREIIKRANGLFLDFFDAFLGPLEQELKVKSSRAQGKAHGMSDIAAYTLRINATNFALANDDGAITRDYDRADIILVGVSR